MNELFSKFFFSSRDQTCRPLGPNPGQVPKLKDQLDQLKDLRGVEEVYPYLSTGVGHGPYTQSQDGSVKLDLVSGMGIYLLGHGHPLIYKAKIQTLSSNQILAGGLLLYPEAKEFTQSIIELAGPSKLDHFWFSPSGAMANDTALKLLWQKKAPHYKLITLKHSFAGRSIATQDISSNENYKKRMPKVLDVFHVPGPDQTQEDSWPATFNALEQVWKEEKGEFCGLLLELVQGDGGLNFATTEYYRSLAKWVKEKNLYLWADEVQTFGRTYQAFAFQTFNLEEYVDIVTVGKALHNSGVLYSQELNPEPGTLGGTIQGGLSELVFGSMLVKYLKLGPFFGKKGRIAQIESNFLVLFEKLQNTYPEAISEFGGIGTMLYLGIGNGDHESTHRFLKILFDNGIIAYRAGKKPSRVRFLLPLCLTDSHLKEIELIMAQSIEQWLNEE